jgi:hypothetical protein
MSDYIVRVYRKSKTGPDHPVCDIRMSGSLGMSSRKFANLHGGDFLVILTQQDYEEEIGESYSI